MKESNHCIARINNEFSPSSVTDRDLFINASTLARESLGPKARMGFTFDDAKIAQQLHSHLAFD